MDAPVIVVGAGPAGLMLAGELRLAGVGVIVVERLARRSGESRGIGFTTRTMEIFDQRDLLRRLGGFETSELGHFGGMPLNLGVLDSAHQAAKTVPQSVTEAALESWAVELGVDLRRGRELEDLREDADGVSVDVRSTDGATDGARETLRGRYLVGCDGGRSVVRKIAGFDFPGTAATTELFLADLRGVELEPRMTGVQLDAGMVMVAKLGDGVHRIIVGERGAPPQRRAGPPAFAEVADTWKRLTGIDISHGEPIWVSAFGDAARLVTEYRRGRVLLAGDAAHVHLPAGGQGMNTSVQDSVNLGWKLGAVLRGDAPESLLDTYHQERHEVGRRLLRNTQAQSLFILGGSEVQPLREILMELIAYPEVAGHLAAAVSGLDIRYDVGGGTHPLLGRRMPHLRLTVAGRPTGTTELLRAARPVLLDLCDNEHLRRRAEPWRTRVDVVTAWPKDTDEVGRPSWLARTSALLIRPDGHVAWAAPGSHDDLAKALTRWCGPARGRNGGKS